MFKKLSFKTLAIIFVFLLVIIAVIWYVDNKKGERTFKKELIDASGNEITSVVYTPDLKNPDEVKIIREGSDWIVYRGNKGYRADSMYVTGLINSLVALRPERVAATDPSKWKDFQVDDSAGTNVRLYKNKDLVADLVIGKFSYIPEKAASPYGKPQGKMTTYVRIAGDNEVYAVDGFVNTSFRKNINAMRDKAIMRSNKDDLLKLEFTYPGDSSFTLSRQGTRWMMGNVFCDSVKMVRYLTSLSRLNSVDLVDDVSVDESHPAYQLTVAGNNMQPVEIKAFPADSSNTFIITSSINNGTYFKSDLKKLFSKVFVGHRNFLP